jgi:three-Cys-motif partner protein
MTRLKSEKYEIDPTDHLRREIVGEWSPDKHARLRRYVDITYATRRKYDKSGSTYIDLYCGPGRARTRESSEVVDGSALVAAIEAARHAPFTTIHIGDLDGENVTACAARLERLKIPTRTYVGDAGETSASVVGNLNAYGLHLAFLDPYSISALPFSVLSTLGAVKRMDLLIHVSVMDLQRNARLFMDNGVMESFAPGWPKAVHRGTKNATLVPELFRHWRGLLEKLGYKVSDSVERVTGSKNQPLYLLVLAARHDIADKFWTQVSNVEPQGRLI